MVLRRWRATFGKVLLALALCWISRSFACLPECQIRCEDADDGPCRSVSCTCSHLGWTGIPTLNNPSVIRSLALSGNSFAHLRNHSFLQLTSLEELVLTNDSITSLEPSTFKSLNRAVLVNLSGNAIERINGGEFGELASLERLDLSRNSISYLASAAFEGLGKLRTLDLSGNSISTMLPDMFAGLDRLTSLDLSYNSIRSVEAHAFQSLASLQALTLAHNSISAYNPWALSRNHAMVRLVLSHNRMSLLPATFTLATPTLQFLDLADNLVATLNQSQFAPGKHLKEIDLSGSPRLTALLPDAFAELPSLERVNVSHCPRLRYVNTNAFRDCVSLQALDFRDGGLQSLPESLLSSLTSLRRLRLDRNRWWCNCSLHWLSAVQVARPDLFGDSADVRCAKPAAAEGRSVFDGENYRRNCSNASVTFYVPVVSFRIESTALLECQTEGDPSPAITWSTPKNSVLHWYPEDKALAALQQTDSAPEGGAPTEPSGRVRVLKNGNLFISNVKIEDAGIYTCLADNSLGNHSVSMRMTLDYEIMVQVKVVSILVGLATSVAFLLTMLVAQLVHMILNRWGWCCCRGKLPPKAKKVRKMLESIEHYKTQQLDRLRENYTMQVQRIKDNGTQQMEWLRESYYSQTDKLRDIRDYGTLQIDRMRDQYYDQVRRVRDYSVQQMSRVRENYVSQRNRIRKFSAHQLFKLRENYKVQQMHLNKILENLNLESCRTVCARTDSVMFTSEITMDPTFVQGGRAVKPIRLDGSPGSDDSSEFGGLQHGDVEMGNLMLPLGLGEEYELRPLPRGGALADEEKGMPNLTLPVLLLHADLPTVHEGDRTRPTTGGGRIQGRPEEGAELGDVLVVMGATSPGSSPGSDGNAVSV